MHVRVCVHVCMCVCVWVCVSGCVYGCGRVDVHIRGNREWELGGRGGGGMIE